jgi:hypothetical protein
VVAADCYRVGPLAHLLKNRSYIGEIVYRGEVHQGEHELILDRDLFEAAQALLKEKVVERSTIRASSPSLLTGRIFDDRNNPMTPTHANKKGVRYRYYVSHALLQSRKTEAGSVARVSAPDVELLIASAIRAASDANHTASDRELIREHVARAIVGKDHIAIVLRHRDAEGATRDPDDAPMLSIPFTPNLPLRKGVAHAPSGGDAMDEATRSALLMAIARSRAWVDAIIADRTNDFATIAEREKLAERHVRFLAPLAYLSPRIIEAIAEGRAPADLTVTRLVRGLPMVWAEQEKQLGFA